MRYASGGGLGGGNKGHILKRERVEEFREYLMDMSVSNVVKLSRETEGHTVVCFF